MVSFDLTNRVVVVTGAGSGIGAGLVEAALQQGAVVAMVDVDQGALEAVRAGLSDTGRVRAVPFTVDLTDRAAVFSTFDGIVSEFETVHGVVACAGISRPSASSEQDPSDWSAVLEVNMSGAFYTAQAAFRAMPDGGSIVLIGSTDSLGGQSERTVYAASKHGVLGLARSLAIEWGRSGIRVNVVAPGPVDTPMARKIHTPESLEETFVRRIPLGRMSTVADQANACLFLLSDASAFISGAVLPVDGGLTAGYFNDFPRK